MKCITFGVKVLIVEDDLASSDMLKELFRSNFKECEVRATECIWEAKLEFEKFLPEILILDINLPDGNSMTFLKSLYQQGFKDIKVIFTTAYSKYALDAFRLSAIDFLLKPISQADFINGVKKVMNMLQDEHYRFKLETLFNNEQKDKEEKIVLKTQDNIHIVTLKDIVQIQADNNYTNFYLYDGGNILVSKSLKKYEQELSKFQFLRVHQSHLVNTKHIKSYNRRNHSLKLINGTNIPVAQAKKHLLLEFFNEF